MNTNLHWIQLLQSVAHTADEEIDCDAFLERVGAFLEHQREQGRLSPELRQVAQHVEVCPECREELEALVELRLSE